MQNVLAIRKVNSLPSILNASTLYLLTENTNKLVIVLTNKIGDISYRNYVDSDISTLADLLIDISKDTINGIAELDINNTVNSNQINNLDVLNLDISNNGNSIYELINVKLEPYDGTAPAAIGNTGKSYSGLNFLKSVSKYGVFNIVLPFDYAINTDLVIRIPYSVSTVTSVPVGSIRFQLEYNITEPYSNPNNTVNNTVRITFNITTISVANSVFYSDITIPYISDMKPGAILRARLARLGASDTFNSAIMIANVGLIYRKNKIASITFDPPT